MPPAAVQAPDRARVPETFRFRITPVAWTVRNRPAPDISPETDRPVMLWPLPIKVPPKEGIGEKDIPSKEMSVSRTTYFPMDQVSRRQESARSRRSSAVRI